MIYFISAQLIGKNIDYYFNEQVVLTNEQLNEDFLGDFFQEKISKDFNKTKEEIEDEQFCLVVTCLLPLNQ